MTKADAQRAYHIRYISDPAYKEKMKLRAKVRYQKIKADKIKYAKDLEQHRNNKCRRYHEMKLNSVGKFQAWQKKVNDRAKIRRLEKKFLQGK
jgi:hypothetical protein